MNRSHLISLLGWVIILALLLTGSQGRVLAQTGSEPPSESDETISSDLQASDPTPFPEEAEQQEDLFAGSLAPTTTYTVTLGAWRNLRPTESFLRDVSLLSPDHSVDCVSSNQKSKGWIVGDDGAMLTYCNGVWDQAIVPESVVTDLYGVQAILPTLGVAVGGQGTVLMYLFDSIALDYVWTKSPIPVGNQDLLSISMVADGAGYSGWAVGKKDTVIPLNGALVRGTITPIPLTNPVRYSYTWDNVTLSYPSLPAVDQYSAVQMLTPNNGWAVGGKDGASAKGVILHWNGSGWSLSQEVGNRMLLGLYMRSANDGWAVGKGGVIYHYNGSSWQSVPSPTTQILHGVEFDANGEGWIVGEEGTLLKFVSGSWIIFNDLRTDPFDFSALDFTSGHGWLVGFNSTKAIGGQILEFTENAWLAVTPPTDNRLNDVSPISDNEAWAVGSADVAGGTIIHWDGRHWQRWFQKDLPIPAVDLYTVDMVSLKDGWAAGDPPATGAPAVFLHWDGSRWAPPRFDAPINVRVNSLDMLDSTFGWAVADDGNAVAKYTDDGYLRYWSANHTCFGTYYQTFDTSIVPSPWSTPFNWDAWSVVWETVNNHAFFMRYMDGCSSGFAWQEYQYVPNCSGNQDENTFERGIRMIAPDSPTAPTRGMGGGNDDTRAIIHIFDGSTWQTAWCNPVNVSNPPNVRLNPSRVYSVDILEPSEITWFGGYYTYQSKKYAMILYYDATGVQWAGIPFPLNGRNVYHRPVRSVDFSSDTMGWAVGDGEASGKLSVIFQYPYPNFTLNSSPEFRAIMPGEVTTYTIRINSIGGFNADTSLDIPAGMLPAGITAGVNPATINNQDSATVTVAADLSTSLGVYDLPLFAYSTFRSGDHDIPVVRLLYLHLTVTNHPIYNVNPAQGPSGTIVNIYGANFGSDPGVGNRSTLQNHVIVAGAMMPDASVVSWTDSQISVLVPDSTVLFPDGPVVGEVSVTSNGEQGNPDFNFQLQNYIQQITYDIGATDVTVTLHGSSFGLDPGSLFRSTAFEHITLNGSWIPIQNILSWTNNAIVFVTPKSTPPGILTVTSNGYESNLVRYDTAKKIYVPSLVR